MEIKQTKGRQKIEMKMIDDEEDRLISFSKRRSGIYKKASELSTLCGTEIGIVVFSPSGKPFTYGNPSLEAVINRFLNQNPPQNSNTLQLVEAHRRVRIHELNQQYNELMSELDSEKKRTEMLKQVVKPKARQAWWEAPVDELSMHQVEHLTRTVDEIHRSVTRRMSELRIDAAASTSSISVPPPSNPTMGNYPFPSEGGYDAGPSSGAPPNTAYGGYGFGHGRGFY